jgi:hypothetical protein
MKIIKKDILELLRKYQKENKYKLLMILIVDYLHVVLTELCSAAILDM